MRTTISSFLTVLVAADCVSLAAAQTQFTCPEDKGKTVVKSGKKYELKCDEGIRGMPMEPEQACSTLEECAERCAATKDCLHSTFIGKTGKCALKKTGDVFSLAGLSTWFFVENVPDAPPTDQKTPTQGDSGHDPQKPLVPPAGGGVDPGNQASYTCPGDEKKTYTTNGIRYELRCSTGHSVTHWKYETTPTLTDCADRCSREPECYSCDWERTTKACAFKRLPSQLTPWAPGDAWYPAPCPQVRETQAKKEPAVTTSLQCPDNDGKAWEGSDGTWFYLQCCTDTGVATVVEQGSASSHKDCLEKCVANKQCKSVSFDSTAATDNCRMYGNGKFSTTPAERVHHAFVTYPPTKPAELTKSKRCSTDCPFANGQLFVAPTGENYLMSCNKRHGTTVLSVDRRDSFEACMASCGAMPECLSVEFEARTKRCFYGASGSQPSVAADAFASAHSLGCAGACAACRKGRDQAGQAALPADAAGCEQDHGQLLVAGGEQMRLRCSHCWHSDKETIRSLPHVGSLAECAKACGEDDYCHGGNWMGPAGCNLHPRLDKNGAAPVLKQNAECDSVTPLSRSLAEYKDEDIQDSGNFDRKW